MSRVTANLSLNRMRAGARPSLILCIATYAIVGITLFLMSSPTVLAGNSLLVGTLLYPFNIYTLLSGIFALVSVALAISEIRSRGASAWSLVAPLSGGIFVALYAVILVGVLPWLAKRS